MLSKPNTQFLNRQDAADYLNLKKSTLEAWSVRGGGPAYRKFGRAVRYCLSDLEQYAEESKRQNTSHAGI
jgi:excisionase family DNA binding protein